MSKKLYHCPMCGHTPMVEVMKKNKQLTRYKVICSCGIMTAGCIEKKNAVIRWNTRHQPAHETVEQWEERTGQTYPDDGPVWGLLPWVDVIDYELSTKHHLIIQGFPMDKLFVATHHGKPEDHTS